MRDIKDAKGNKIIWEEKKWKINLYLYLRWYEYRRSIWTIDEENKTLIVKRDPKKHIFQKNNSYWFNSEIINRLPKDWKVIVREPKITIIRTTTIKDILENKSYLHFNTEWFELQNFYPRSKMWIDIL